MDGRNRWLFLSAVFLPLGTAVGTLFGVIWLFKKVAPDIFMPRNVSGLELIFGMTILLMTLIVGFLLGTIVLVLVWRPHVPRSTLEDIVTKPHVPLISPLMVWFFERIYPSDE